MRFIVSSLYQYLFKRRKNSKEPNDSIHQLELELKQLSVELSNNVEVQHRIISRFVYPGSRLELLRNELIQEEKIIRDKIKHTQNEIRDISTIIGV
jgi:hypothetical protein